jgi:formylglycine-generating enzyme required for sulfatase activity
MENADSAPTQPSSTPETRPVERGKGITRVEASIDSAGTVALSADQTIELGEAVARLAEGNLVFGGRYALERPIGRGGMGIVWLAMDRELRRQVALKFLPDALMFDPKAVEGLKSETRKALELTHHHIVRIHDFLTEGGMAAISMEYIDGDSLAKLQAVRPGRVFEVAELAPWVAQLCAALGHAHGKGRVVHRDLKPGNLMVNARGELKVADFGIAARLQRTKASLDSTRSLMAGRSSGTPAYMSPQQMMGEAPSPADDIYALGATLYELLTGEPPFFDGDMMALGMQVLNKVPPPVGERRGKLGVSGKPIPKAWEEAIAACLAKAVAARPGSAAEVAARLGLKEEPVAQGAPAEVAEAEVPSEVFGVAGPAALGRMHTAVYGGYFATGALSVVSYLLSETPDEGGPAGIALLEILVLLPLLAWMACATGLSFLCLPRKAWVFRVVHEVTHCTVFFISMLFAIIASQTGMSWEAKSIGWGLAVLSATGIALFFMQPREAEAGHRQRRWILWFIAAVMVLLLGALAYPPVFRLLPWVMERPETPKQEGGGVPGAGQARVVAQPAIELQWVAPGTFTMGDNVMGYNPYSVELTKGYWMGRYEVTQSQWMELIGVNPSGLEAVGHRIPVAMVSWAEAMAFCQKLTQREKEAGRLPEGYAYSLPTEAQWSKAAKEGKTPEMVVNPRAYGWFADNALGQTHPVGEKKADALGLFDLHGNVSEWCLDWYESLPDTAQRDPAGPASGTQRVICGASIIEEPREQIRQRNRASPDAKSRWIGFRVALVAL